MNYDLKITDNRRLPQPGESWVNIHTKNEIKISEVEENPHVEGGKVVVYTYVLQLPSEKMIRRSIPQRENIESFFDHWRMKSQLSLFISNFISDKRLHDNLNLIRENVVASEEKLN